MKLPDSCRTLTKLLKVPILAAGTAALLLPFNASAQTCGGAISATVQPGQSFLLDDLSQTITVTYFLEVGSQSADMRAATMNVGLTCKAQPAGTDPGSFVPCIFGNDLQADSRPSPDPDPTDPTDTPITFVSYDPPADLNDPTYCPLDLTTPVTDNGDGTVTFHFRDPTVPFIGQTPCQIPTTQKVVDKGTDDTANKLTQVLRVDGYCSTFPDDGDPGSASGSLPINIEEPICIPEIEVCVAVDTDDDGSFDDETCDAHMIGLNETGGPGDSTLDPAKDFKYFIEGSKAANSEDLGACQVQKCIAFDGPECTSWVDITSEFSLDNPLSTPIETIEEGVCSPNGDERTYRIVCDTCTDNIPPFDIPSETPPASADVECADCDVRIEKEVTCDDGFSWGESCTGWDGADETGYRYQVWNTSEDASVKPRAVDIDSCTVGDNGAPNPADWPGVLNPGDNSDWIYVYNATCEEGEGSTLGTVDCACLPTKDDAPLTIGDNVVGPNTDPSDGSNTFITQNTTDTDGAMLMCESAGLNVGKMCEDQDVCEGTNNVTIIITNATDDTTPVPYEADLTNCTVDDALLTTGPSCTYENGGTQALTIPFSIMGSNSSLTPGSDVAIGPVTCTGTVVGLTTDTLNSVTVTCDVEDTCDNVETCKQKTATATDMCTTVPCEGCYTRTPGFWGTHPHIADLFVDDDDDDGGTGLGPLTSCGVAINEVTAETDYSSTEDMCSVGKDSKSFNDDESTSNQQAQLVRQCMAAMLNIAASGTGGGSCGEYVDRVDYCCNTLCPSGAAGGDLIACIEDVDEFNNSPDEEFEWDNTIIDNPFISPGPANSQYCRDSKNNGWMNPGSPETGRTYGPRSN